MTKYRSLIALIAVVSILATNSDQVSANGDFGSQFSPVAFDGHSGNVTAEQLVEQTTNWNNDINSWTRGYPAWSRDTYPVRVCGPSSCELVRASYEAFAVDPIARTLSRRVSLTVGELFGRQPVTLSFPIDALDLSKGWTSPSNSVSGWTNLADLTQVKKTDQAIEFKIRSLTATTIWEVRACFNRVEELPFLTSPNLPAGRTSNYVDLTGYSSATYELEENGKIVREGTIRDAETVSNPPYYTGPSDWRRFGGLTCGEGNYWSFEPMNFAGLNPGSQYKIRYRLDGPGKPQLSGELVVVTPGGCPTSELSPNPYSKDNIASIRPNTLAYLDVEGTFLGLLPTDTHDWRAQSAFLSGRVAPVIDSQVTSPPFNGAITPEKIKTEDWKYVRETGDWALVTDGTSPISTMRTLRGTAFAACTESQVSVAAQSFPTGSQEVTCKVVYDQIIATSPGLCYVRVIIRRKGVSGANVTATPGVNTLKVPYIFTSQSRFEARPRGSVTINSSRTKTISTHILLAKVRLDSKKLKSFTISSSKKYSSTCKVRNRSVQTLRKIGTCVVTIRAKTTARKTITKTLWIDIRN